MTEKLNLCKEVLENAIGVYKTCAECFDEGLSPLEAVSVQAMEELLKYRAIGTVEELQAFRSNDFTEDLLNMGYTKGLKDGYAKAVDEVRYALDETTYNINDADALFDDIVEILENMKGGAE